MVVLNFWTRHLLAHGVSCQFFSELHLGDGNWTQVSDSLTALAAKRLGTFYSGFLSLVYLTEDHIRALFVTLVSAKRHILLVFMPHSGRLERQLKIRVRQDCLLTKYTYSSSVVCAWGPYRQVARIIMIGLLSFLTVCLAGAAALIVSRTMRRRELLSFFNFGEQPLLDPIVNILIATSSAWCLRGDLTQ